MVVIEVRIGELVVHGFPVADPGGFGDAVAGSLERLLADRGLPAFSEPNWLQGDQSGSRKELAPSPATVQVPSGASSSRLADQVAHAVWRSLGGEPENGR
jgi:hypothetical protein